MKRVAKWSALLLLSAAMFTPASAVPGSLPADGDLSGAGALWLLRNNGGTTTNNPTDSVCDGSAGLNVDTAFLDLNNNGDPSDDPGVFDKGATLWVGTDIVTSTVVEVIEQDRSITTPSVTMTAGGESVLVSMNYYAAQDTPTLRVFADFRNPSTSTVTATVTWATNLASGSDTTILDSSADPTSTFSTADGWVVTSDDPATPTAAPITHVIWGPESDPTTTVRAEPSAVSGVVYECPDDQNPLLFTDTQGVLATFSLPVPPLESASLMFFHHLSRSNEDASSEAAALFNQNPPADGDLLNGLSAAQLFRVRNWDFTFDDFIVTGSGPGVVAGATIHAVDALNGVAVPYIAITPFSLGFTGGTFVAAGDLDGDSKAEIVTGAGPGGGPTVKVWDLDLSTGRIGKEIPGGGFVDGVPRATITAFAPSFKGGVRVAVGDVSAQGGVDCPLGPLTCPADELVTAAGPGGGPRVKVWRLDEETLEFEIVADWEAYDVTFSSGISVAAGDIDSDQSDEVIVGPGPGVAGMYVKVFDLESSFDSIGQQPVHEILVRTCPSGCVGLTGVRQGGFRPFSAGFSGGDWVASSNVDGVAGDEIIVGAGPGNGPVVSIFKYDKGTIGVSATFVAYSSGFTGGVALGAGDIDGDGIGEVLTAAGPTGGAWVRAFTIGPTFLPSPILTFLAHPQLLGGAWVSVIPRPPPP